MEQSTILIVDDNPVNLRVLMDYLHKTDIKTLVAKSGEDAIQQIERAKPDLILLDVIMPGIDGFETCRRLKENSATQDIPIIFMTVMSHPVSIVKGFEAGGSDYITKPFHYKEVWARVNAQLTIRKLKKQLAIFQFNTANTDKASTILLVDDDPMNLHILLSYLSKLGFKTLIAQSGEDALRQGERARPELILLDILMPGLDGFETCRRLKENPLTRKIPVIFMTALTDINDKLKGFDAGGADYITKPINYSEVVARVNAHLTVQKLQQQLA